MNVYHPLINKRKASSVLELTRSPQEVINDFILNQLGNFDFNDKFADPRDINKEFYNDMRDFAKDFFDHYDISLDVNKYIRAQAAIFNKELIRSLKRLVPARAQFSKVGIELKPTFLERQKLNPHTFEKEIQNLQGTIERTDWEENEFVNRTLENLLPAITTKDTTIELGSPAGNKREFYKFNEHTLFENKDTTISITSEEGKNSDYYEFDEHTIFRTKDTTIELGSPAGNKSDFYEFNDHKLFENKDTTITITSEDGNSSEYYEFNDHTQYEPLDGNIEASSHTGSVAFNFKKLEPLYASKDSKISVASSTGSIAWNFDELQSLYTTKDTHFDVASSTGSISWNFTENELLYSNKDFHFNVASSTGSIAKDFSKLEPL